MDEIINNLEVDWEGHSGAEVQEFIKKYLSEVEITAKYFVTSQDIDGEGFYHILGFRSREDYDKWRTTDDQDEKAALLLTEIPIKVNKEESTSFVTSIYSNSNRNYIVSTNGIVTINIKFVSQSYNPVTHVTTDTGETGTLTIQRRPNGTSSWETVDTRIIESIEESQDRYTVVDISDQLNSGNQQVRVMVVGNDSDRQTSYITFNSVVKTTLDVRLATEWWKPFTNGKLSLSYYIEGAVAKNLRLIISGQNGQSRELSYSLGVTTYQETPYQVPELDDSNPADVPIITQGIHDVEAWIEVSNDSTVQSKHVKSQVLIITDASIATPTVILSEINRNAVNWTQVKLFDYALYTPDNNPIDIIFKLTDYDKEITHMSIVAGNVTPGQKKSFNNVLEIEGTQPEIDAYLNIYDNENNPLIDQQGFNIDNSNNFAPTSEAAFILNPKIRSNEELTKNTIINGADNTVVPATFTNFGFVSDGWVEDNTGVRSLRVLAKRFLAIDYESFTDFMSNNNTSSLTIELDFKTFNVDDETEPVLQMCTNYQDNLPLGFWLRPMDAAFLTGNKRVYLDQDIQFQEGVRTHVAVNILYNLGNNGYNYVRLFVNGIINREFWYATNDTFVQYVDSETEPGTRIKTSKGIRIGSNSADIDIYSIRIYKKALSATDIRQDYVASLQTTEEKFAFRDANDILGDSGEINYAAAKAKGYNTMLWTGDVPSYINDARCKGSLEIFIPNEPEHSGIITKLEAKGQGSSSKGYWKWNQQYSFKDKNDVNLGGTWIDGNGVDRGQCYQVMDDTPEASKLVAKLNWASPQQSHKLGSTALYNDLWKRITGGNSITATTGYENCRVAVIERPFFFFVRENETSDPVFYSLMTFGPGKADKPTFGYIKGLFTYPMIEGSDNGMPLTECRVPWIEDDVIYDEDEEAFCYNGKNPNWDLDLDKPETAVAIFKPALNFVFRHTTNILPYSGTYSELKVDANVNNLYQYWVTENDDPTGTHKYDLFRYDFITSSWVGAGETKNGPGDYSSLNIDDQCGNIATGNDWEAINQAFINWRVTDFKTNAGTYFNMTDMLFSYTFCHMVAASDNRCKNIYFYADPVTHKIGCFQDDLDTILATDNVGRKAKPYYVEEHDINEADNNKPYWNGSNNAMYNVIELAYKSELVDMQKTIFETMASMEGSVFACMEKYYFSVQRYFPAVAYNEIARLLYEDAQKNYGSASEGKRYNNPTPPLPQSLGDQLQCELQWWKRREIYLSSYCCYGEFDSGRPTGSLGFRSIVKRDGSNPTYTFSLVPHMWLYPSVNYGQSKTKGRDSQGNEYALTQRVKAGGNDGQPFVIQITSIDGNTDVYIPGANYYTQIGDFGDLPVGEQLQLIGDRLQSFNGSGDRNTIEFRPTGIIVSLPTVKYLNLSGAATLIGGIDFSSALKLEYLNLDWTNITSVDLPATDVLSEVHLPYTIQAIELNNQPGLSRLYVQGVANLSKISITLKNAALLDTKTLLVQCFEDNAPLAELHLHNIIWNEVSVDVATYLTTITDCDLSGEINLRQVSTNRLSFANKRKLINKFGAVDSRDNPLFITYEQATLSTASIIGDSYIRSAGQFQYDVVPGQVNGNDFVSIKWSADSVLDPYGFIDEDTGVITTTKVGTSSSIPRTVITCTITKINGDTIIARRTIGIYDRPAEIGDYVYADGEYSDVLDSTKTVVGICFWAKRRPDGSYDRRMVATSNIGSYPWGLYPVEGANGFGSVSLENPNVVNNSVFDITTIGNITAVGLTKTSDGSSYSYITADTYIDNNEEDGFKVYGNNTVAGDFAEVELTSDYIGLCNIIDDDGYVKPIYEEGDPIPSGRLKTLKIIVHRNAILNDGNINLDTPTRSETKSEFEHLTELLTDVVNKAAQDGDINTSRWRQFYWPAASYCYAYQPTIRTSEVLNDRFRAHNWYLPSSGELARLYWYHQLGYSTSVANAVFAKAYQAGKFTAFSSSSYWSSTEYSSYYAWYVIFSNGGLSTYYSRYDSLVVRAVAAF